MSDLFDAAKPIRDAMMIELKRVLDDDVPEPVNEGYRLGMHLSCLVMAAIAKRLGGLSGQVEAEGLLIYFAVAMAQVLTYAALGFRPMRQGQPIDPMENLINLANMTIAHAAQQIEIQQAGGADFVVPFEMKPDGVITPKGAFDFQDLLNKGGA